GRVQVLDLDERVRVFADIEQERGDVLAVAAGPDGAGAIGRFDGVAVEGDGDAVGARGVSLAPAFDGATLDAQVAPHVLAEICLRLVDAGLADLPDDFRLGEPCEFDHDCPPGARSWPPPGWFVAGAATPTPQSNAPPPRKK